jgi:ectoine hydroxylase-related dioxygenase (phytanoyl-CoA dioxygenase family)
MAVDPASFTLSADCASEAIVARVEDFGLAVVPGWADAASIAALDDEFDRVLELKAPWVRPVTYKAGRAVSVDLRGLDTTRFPATRAMFSLPRMAAVAEGVVGGDNTLNREIFFTRDEPRPHRINELHFDRIPTLKFFLYLRDTSAANGALECVPGSHRRARAMREQAMARGVRVIDLPNFEIPSDLPPPQPIDGPAGTMIVFHTDMFHRGGNVGEGRERRVIRGHTHPRDRVVYHPPVWSKQWWREAVSRARPASPSLNDY